MKPPFFIFFISVLVFVLIPGLAKALINVNASASPSSINAGESVTINVTVTSSWPLRGDAVLIFWGGTVSSHSCVIIRTRPAGKCSFSAIHTYTNEGNFRIQVTATNTNILPETGIRYLFINVGPAALAPPATDRYPNPIEAENVVEFIHYVLNYLYPFFLILVILFILIGSYVLITSQGMPARVALGKKIIIYAIVALIIMFTSRGLMQVFFQITGVEGVN